MITKLRLLLSFLGIVLALNVTAQRASDGSYTVSSANQVVNTYTTLTANASAGATTISVANSSMSGGAMSLGNLGPGDLILIIQMYGGTVDVNWSYAAGGATYTLPASWPNTVYTFGQMLTYEQVGLFERAEVVSAGGGSITISCGLENTYDAADGVQIVRIPRLDDLTVNSGASIVPPLWNGSTGGIVALEVDGTLTLNSGGSISASAYGYRGGQVDTDFFSGAATTDLTWPDRFPGSPDGKEGSERGEGIYGFYTQYDAIYSRYGKGAIGNGGGGAGYVNAGGGGGSNAEVSPTSYNGRGTPIGYAAAWALDATATGSSGGGSGGYCLSQTDQNALAVGPVNASWGGDARKNNGGWGGHPIPYSAARIYFGGGGGAGDQDSGQGGSGGRGGGIVYIVNYGTMAGSGTIEVNGEDGQNSNPNNQTLGFNQYKGNDGAGGGGAAGTVYIENATVIPNTININAIGGNGGDQALQVNTTFGGVWEAGGPGGAGSGGVIRFSSGAPTQDVSSGANGTTTSTHLTEFPPNGATEGATGEANLSAPYYDLIPVHDTICAGQAANPAVTVNGSYTGTLDWYTQQYGGTPIAGQTNQLSYSVSPGTTTSYWVGVCPGTFRVEVIVTVTAGVNLVTTDPAPVCSPATVDITLPAITAGSDPGTLTYWQDNQATVTEPTPTAVGGGWHYIQLDGGGCAVIDSVFVTVNAPDDASFNYGAATYCTNDADPTPTITGLAGGTFSSAPGGLSINASTGQIDVSASTPNTYTVTYTTAGPCPNSSNVSVTITTQDDATFNYAAATYCANDSDPTPTATTAGGTYTSSPAGLVINASTGQIDLSASTPNAYTVTYTTAGACPNSSNVSVTINAVDDATFNYSAASYCANDADPTPTATTAGGTYTSSPAGLSINASTGQIDVSASTPNTYTVTYTTAGACSSSSNVSVTIDAVDDATFNYGASSYCTTDADPTPTATTAGGTYTSSPAGLSINASTGQIDVSASTPNSYTVTYTTAGACPASSNFSVTINAVDDATFNYSASAYCTTDADPTPTATTAGGTYTSSPAGLSINASTGQIDVSASTPNTYTVTYTTAGTCPASSNVSVTINAVDDATFSYAASTYCINDADPTPTATTAGGTYTSSPAGLVINASTGQIDVSASTPNSYTVTYTTAGACPSSSNVSVTITALDDATFNYSASSYCTTDADPTPTATTAGGTYTSSPAGLSINASTGQIDVSASTPNTYTVTYTTAGACSNSSNASVTINAPDDASFSYAASAYCINDADPTPTITGLAGGTFSSAPAGLVINASTGQIDVSASTPNTYTVTYTTAGACPNTSNVSVTINGLDDATFNSFDFCASSVNTISGVATPGGTFSIQSQTGSMGVTINGATGILSNYIAGDQITILYTTPAGGCQNTFTVTVNVTNLDDASFTSTDFCVSGTNTISSVATPGGTFSISAQTGSATIDPSTGILSGYAAGDQVTIQYTTPAGGCQNSSTQVVNVLGLDDATFVSGDFCASGVNTISGVVTPGGTFAIQSQTGSNAATIDPSTGILSNFSGGDQITIEYTTPAGGCQNSSTQVVNVNPTPVITTTPTAISGCNADDGQIAITDGGNASGSGVVSWSGPVSSNSGTITLPYTITSLPPGTYDVTFTDNTTGCVSAIVQETFVNPAAPDITPITDLSDCDSVQLPAIAGTNLTGNQAYFDGPNGTGNQYAAGDWISSTITLYAYDVNGLCSDDETFNVTIHSIPVAAFTANPTSGCAVPHTVFFTDNSTLPDTWFWDFGDANTSTAQNPIHNYTSFGTFTVTLTVTDTILGCSDVATGTITVLTAPVLDPVANLADCDSVQLAPITGANLTGNEAYYTGTGGTGTMYNAGDWITAGGTYYAYDASSACSNEPSFTVTVNPSPTVSGPTEVCVNATIALSGTGTPDGSTPWSSSNTSVATVDNVGNVAGVAAGTVTITYLDNNGCSNTQDVTVNALPTILGTPTVCVGASTALSGSGTPDASTPWVSSNTAVATVDNTGNVTGVAAGSATITYMNDLGCTMDQAVTVNPLDDATFVTTDFCASSVNTISSVATPGGTFSIGAQTGSATINSSTGVLSNFAAGDQITILYITSGTCPNSSAVTINVTPLDDASFNSYDFCESSVNTISNVATSGGTFSISSQTGSATIDPSTGILSNFSAGDQITIMYTTAGTCANSSTVTVNVTTLDDASFVSTDFCESSVNTISSVATPGGTFAIQSQTGSATIDPSTGILSGYAAGDQIVIEYTTPAGGCQNTGTQTVNVTPLDDASFTSADFCESSVNTISNVATPGGTFSISTQTGSATIDPSTGVLSNFAAGDQIDIMYTTAGACPNSSTVTVNVTPLDDASFTSADFCESSVNTISNVATSGGTFSISTQTGSATIDSSTGVLSNFVAGDQITIMYTTAGTCPNSSTVTVNVTSQDDASFTSTDFCESSVNTISNVATPGGTFAIQSQTGSATIDAATGVLSNVAAGDQIVIEYTTPAGACQNTSTQTVNVIASDDGTFAMTATCDGGTALVSGLAGGTFAFTSAPGDGAAIDATTGTVSNGTGGTTYSVDYTTNGTCPVTTTETVTVVDQDDATFSLIPTCDGATAFISGTSGGTFSLISSGGEVIDPSTGTVTGGAYNAQIEVQYVTSGACPDSTTEIAIIDDCTPNDIIIPTAFTPGSDGANDTWEIVSLDNLYPDNIVMVYNRWGNKVFEHQSSASDPYGVNEWDGTYNGQLLPVASYYFIIEANDGSGTKFEGTVTIIQ